MPKFYQTPGGTLSTSEKQWKEDMKSEGLDPKEYDGRRSFEITTKAADLMEFLTFHNVNVVNPRADAPAPEIAGGGDAPNPLPPPVVPASKTFESLEDMFDAAPLRLRLDLASRAIDAANTTLHAGSRLA